MKRLTVTAVAAVLGMLLWTPPLAHAAPAGKVRLAKSAGSEMDAPMTHASRARRAWFRRNYTRMKAYAPWFNPRLRWYRQAWAYQDLYAVYSDGREDGSHMRFVLRDGSGRRLYIPWGCNGGSCPQYAADPGNPEFRRMWIAEAARNLRAGYRGLYIDDASLAMSTGDASGRLVAPVDPRTGREMSHEDWRRYVTGFLVAIRHALPKAEIVHNTPWWTAPLSNPLRRRQVRAADWLVIEHAFSDWGLTGGTGAMSFRAYMRHMDALHRMRKHIVLDGEGASAETRELLLAGYLMVNDGGDLLSSGQGTGPGPIWRGYRLGLGRARGRRHRWRGVWRRDFAHGTALLSDPGSPARTLPIRGRRVSGERVSSVTIGDRQGVVITSRTGG
jgi:Hypothetical glycosyl hydrolase family 15